MCLLKILWHKWIICVICHRMTKKRNWRHIFEEISQFSSDDEDYEPRIRTTPPSSIILEIPAQHLTKATGKVDGRDLSLRDHLTMQSALVAAGGGNINDLLMFTTVHRKRQQLRKELNRIFLCVFNYGSVGEGKVFFFHNRYVNSIKPNAVKNICVAETSPGIHGVLINWNIAYHISM